MKEVKSIVYRYLTDAEFFNMYKPTRTETGGGGQLYIDFRTSKIPVGKWQQFFSGITALSQTMVRNGPQWEFPVWSIGVTMPRVAQTLRIYQRRSASICIPNQNINTRSANRVGAWAPADGFPMPPDANDRHALPPDLAVFLVRTYEDEIWAGWFLNNGPAAGPCQDALSERLLDTMLDTGREAGDVGILEFRPGTLYLDETNAAMPFCGRGVVTTASRPVVDDEVATTTQPAGTPTGVISGATRRGRVSTGATTRAPRPPRQRTEEEVIASLLGEDQSEEADPGQTREVVVRIRQRNLNAVRDLKALYQHRCQLTGNAYTFLKRDGTPYTEAHHLISLGNGGADNPRNIIIVSPFVHRMLHYADVSGVDLSRVVQMPDGSATLAIQINGSDFTITWHPQHAERVRRAEQRPAR
jgi:5-methylcytosine-specific restriction protein A